jgi:hypothetical protein
MENALTKERDNHSCIIQQTNGKPGRYHNSHGPRHVMILFRHRAYFTACKESQKRKEKT